MSDPVKHNLRQAAQGSVPPKVRAVLQAAAAVGWTATPRNKRGFWAVSPDEGTRAYVPITIKDENRTAKAIDNILQRWKKAQLEQAKEASLAAPTRTFTLVPRCPGCKRTFKTWVAAQSCQAGHETDEPEVEETLDDNILSTESGIISVPEVEESDVAEEPKKAPNAGVKHPNHSKWQTVNKGLARDLYTAMSARSRGSMPLSSYSNIIAKDIEAMHADQNRATYQDPNTLLGLIQSLVAQVEAEDSTSDEEFEIMARQIQELTEELATEKQRADDAEATMAAAAELFAPKK